MDRKADNGRPVELVRTGLFQYVQIPKIEAFMKRGWMVVDELDMIHGYWAVLMWHCECGAHDP